MIILPEDKKIITLLTSDDAKDLLCALFSTDEDMPELSPLAFMAYTVIKDKNDRLSEKKNEFTDRQSAKGKLGGAPKGNQNAAKTTQNNQDNPNQSKTTQNNLNNPNQPNQPKTSLSVTDTVTDTETGTVSESVTVTDTVLKYDDDDVLTAGGLKASSVVVKDKQTIIGHYQKHIQPIPGKLETDKLCNWLETFPADVIVKAIDTAVMANKRSLTYIEGILRKWAKYGLVTVSLIDGHERERQDKKTTEYLSSERPRNKFHNFTSGREIDYDEIERLEQEYLDKKYGFAANDG